jgi:hypothetical protein
VRKGVLRLESASSADVVAASCRVLRENPYAFVRNAGEVAAWVNSAKAQEMAALAPEERPRFE